MDDATRLHLGKPGIPFVYYEVTDSDMSMIKPTPSLWREKAEAPYLGYNNAWEMLAEKSHSTPEFLRRLNPNLGYIDIGTQVAIPNIETSVPLPKAGRVEILLSQLTLLVYDIEGKLVACFPCSIASDKNKRPKGELRVAVKVRDPSYFFNPDVLTDVAEREDIEEKLTLPAGPNNPVGIAWIGLSLPGYGIHGTPDPTHISATYSHGCFRLANWNARKLFHMVEKGTPIHIKD